MKRHHYKSTPNICLTSRVKMQGPPSKLFLRCRGILKKNLKASESGSATKSTGPPGPRFRVRHTQTRWKQKWGQVKLRVVLPKAHLKDNDLKHCWVVPKAAVLRRCPLHLGRLCGGHVVLSGGGGPVMVLLLHSRNTRLDYFDAEHCSNGKMEMHFFLLTIIY